MRMRKTGSLAAGALALALLAGCAGKEPAPAPAETPAAASAAPAAAAEAWDYAADGDYTCALAVAALPESCDPLRAETAAEREAAAYVTSALYGYALEAEDGEPVPVLAAGLPEDVTEQYAGGSGWELPAGETGRVWRVALNPDACWDDGTPVTATDYVYSLQKAQETGSGACPAAGIAAEGESAVALLFAESRTRTEVLEALTTPWLVRESLYEAGSYGTSPETSSSCGPYRLAEAAGEKLVWERNGTWFGYGAAWADVYGGFARECDGAVFPQYQADRIEWTAAADFSDREALFIRGQSDLLDLPASALAGYENAETLCRTAGDTVFFGVLLSDYNDLLAEENTLNGGGEQDPPESCATPYRYNKTILALDSFREALSLSIDREALCAALYAAGTPETGLIAGAADGTGYDLARARELVDAAADEALARGWMTEESVVSLAFCAGGETEQWRAWYDFLRETFLTLTAGTKLEGRFQLTADFTPGTDWEELIRDGRCDMAWGLGWLEEGGGYSAEEALGLYLDGTLSAAPRQYDLWNDWSAALLTLELNVGQGRREYTYSVTEFWQMLRGEGAGLPDWSGIGAEQRQTVLAGLEAAILDEHCVVPVLRQGTAQLRSYRIRFGRETYGPGLGRGGVRYLTFDYTDGAWAAYCAAQTGGVLRY